MPSGEHRSECAWIALCAGAFYAIGCARGSHFASDDALYAQMAREMLETGDFVDNRWLGVVHFEKPPLLLWSLALSARCFGFGEAALRLPSVLFAILGLCAQQLLARSLEVERCAALSATALLTMSTFYLLLTRRLMTDMPLVACSLACAACALRARPVLAGVFAGLAVLAKGPAALLLLAAGFGYGLWSRALHGRGFLRAALAWLLVAAPWYVLVTLRHGSEFWASFLGHHVSARLTSAVVPGLTWLERLEVVSRERVLLLLGLLGASMSARQRTAAPAARFALLWLCASALPLVVSATVLPHYFLPLAPGLALLATQAASAEHWRARWAPWLAGACVFASLVADPAKLIWWLDPDFGPDHKALGERLGRSAGASDTVFTYNLTNSALVFYSGGMPISIYADDAEYLAVQAAVMMSKRQAGHAGGVFDLRSSGLPALGTGRRFAIARRGEESRRLEHLLRAQAPERALYRSEQGELTLLDDAGEGSARRQPSVARSW
jgi:4-amino-4-deoxy-L-arabinose transferase-like glycosyltransferase